METCCNGNDPACPTHGVAACNARQNRYLKHYTRRHQRNVSDRTHWISAIDNRTTICGCSVENVPMATVAEDVDCKRCARVLSVVTALVRQVEAQ